MIAIFRREMKNYFRNPLFWLGVFVVIYEIFISTSAYMEIHYWKQGEEIVNDGPVIYSGEVNDGYIPATQPQKRELWNEEMKKGLQKEFDMSEEEAGKVIDGLRTMEIEEACGYLEKEYGFYGAIYVWEDCGYYQGTPEEINAYLDTKLNEHSFSFYFSRKFADFAGLSMGFFATILLSVLFWQDTRKHTYELLHTKPISAGKYIVGKAGAGFGVCVMVLFLLSVVFWILCLIKTKGNGFEIRLWDFFAAAILYVVPNLLMIVCIYTLISCLFKNPLPGVPLLILYILYSNMGKRDAEGIYQYCVRPLAIMVRFPGQFFDTALPSRVFWNQNFLLIVSAMILLISTQIWKRRRL